jgi:hypothetical protein
MLEPIDKEPATKEARRSGRSTQGKTPKKLTDETFGGRKGKPTAKAARTMVDPDNDLEPQTFGEAVNHPSRGKQWEKAILEEYNAHIKNGTWRLIPRPKDRKVVLCKMDIQAQAE